MTNKEIRAKARADLGGNIFNSKWLIAIAVYFVIEMIVGVAGCFSLIIAGALYYGLAKYFLKLSRGNEPGFDGMFDGFSDDFTGNLILYLMQFLFVFLWSCIPIVGIFFGVIKQISYSMCMYIKADHPEYDWKTCIDESIRIMEGNKWRYFCLQLSFIGWMLLSLLTCGLGMFWVTPYMQAANANFYKEVSGENLFGKLAETETF